MKNLNKLKRKYEGIDRGLKFVDEFINEITKKYEKKTVDYINIFNINKGEKIKIYTTEQQLNFELREFYKKFLREIFFKNFEWYKEFLNSISKVVTEKFKLNEKMHHDYFHQAMTIIFMLPELSYAKYNYDAYRGLLIDYLEVTGFKNSDEIADDLITGLIKDNLILLERNFFGEKKKFDLSDKYFSIVFGLTAITFPNSFMKDENCICYSSVYNVENLESVINNYYNYLDTKDNYQLAKYYISLEYPELVSKIDDSKDISMNFGDLITDVQKGIVFGLYLTKMVLNEFCFQTVVMTMFEKYYFTSGTKNVLFSYLIHEYRLHN